MARAALPREACGVLGGAPPMTPEDPIEISTVIPVENRADDARRFELDPAGLIDAEDRLEAQGLVMIGVMHSHPQSVAAPSPTDLADAARYDPRSDLLHLIVSLQGFAPQVDLWRYPHRPSGETVAVRLPWSAYG